MAYLTLRNDENWRNIQESRQRTHGYQYSPEGYLVDDELTDDSFSDFGSEFSTTSSDHSDILITSTSRDAVLHPFASAYSRRYPEHDVFSGNTLVDNGYIEQDINMLDGTIST